MPIPTTAIVDQEGNAAETTAHGELKTSTLSLIMYDQVEGATLNTNIWTPSTSGMTIVQSGSFINLNAASAVTANAYAMITSNKVVPFYGEQQVELSTSIMISALPDPNCIVEIGFITCTANNAPTDGAFIRIQNGVARGVINFGGVETISGAIATVAIGAVQDFDIGVDSFEVVFEIDGNKLSDPVPAALPFPTSVARQNVVYRVYNLATPPVAGIKLSIGREEVTQSLVTVNKPWPELLCEMARGSDQLPVSPFTSTSNQANSAAPTAAALSNTVPAYASTLLDGQFKFAAVAGAETDYALFGFQVPVGYQLKIAKISIDTYVEGVAVVSQTTLQWSFGRNSTAASLATVDGAGTVAPRRKALGIQTFGALAALGTLGANVSTSFDPPQVVDSGRWFHIILKIPEGAATASLVFRGVVRVDGFNE